MQRPTSANHTRAQQNQGLYQVVRQLFRGNHNVEHKDTAMRATVENRALLQADSNVSTPRRTPMIRPKTAGTLSNASSESMQDVLAVLLDELHLALDGKSTLSSQQRFTVAQIVEQHNQQSGEWSQFRDDIVALIVAKKAHSSIAIQTESSPVVQQKQAVKVQKYIPKRILYRPAPIRIPMVRVHNARMQEIELLKAASRKDRTDAPTNGVSRDQSTQRAAC
jgi:hypothetical protein